MAITRLVLAATLATLAASPAAADVDFERDVAPILRQHCLKCHGPVKQGGGLRLDGRQYASYGGVSGLPILGGGLEHNEIHRRVTAADDDFRMPRFAPPLPDDELQRLRAWVEAGTPWPDERVAQLPVSTRPPTGFYHDQVKPILPYVLVVLLVGFGLEQLRRRTKTFEHVRLAHLFVVAGALLLVRQMNQTADLHARLVTAVGEPDDGLGSPPMPRRPDHPRRLAGTYYRGNCERDERLYNGGNYRTCSMHVALCDATGRPLEYGDTVPADGLHVSFEIERAVGTTEKMFTDEIMLGVFLTDGSLGTDGAGPEGVVPLEVVEPGWRWRAVYPLPAGSPAGLVYVHRGGKHPDGRYGSAAIHYGLSYDVRVASGRIEPGSEIWLGAIFRTPAVSRPPDEGKVPFESWFDHRPIPLIEGENTDDPVLLGLPDDE